MLNPDRVDGVRVEAHRNRDRHVQPRANQRRNTLLAIALAHIKARDTHTGRASTRLRGGVQSSQGSESRDDSWHHPTKSGMLSKAAIRVEKARRKATQQPKL